MEPAQGFLATNLDLEPNQVNVGQNIFVSADSKNAEKSREVQQQVTNLLQQLTESQKQNHADKSVGRKKRRI